MGRKSLSEEDFLQRVKEINPHIEVIGNYTRMKGKIEWKCKIHNTVNETRASLLIEPKRCPECVKEDRKNKPKRVAHNKKTKEQFIKELAEINDEVELLGEYIDTNTKTIFKCKVCGNIFEMTPHNILRGQNCPKCAMVSRIKNKSISHENFVKDFLNDENIEVVGKYKNSKTPIECHCKICGHIWFPIADNIKRGHGCPKCAIRNNSGENSPNWNPNLTQKDREDKRNYPEYKEWRNKCFERDNYTCQVTGESNIYLEVHHLYSYHDNPDLRTDVDNGITISKEIHKLFHSIYGRGNNTKEQWEEFINNLK